jgi:hypothetical protein
MRSIYTTLLAGALAFTTPALAQDARPNPSANPTYVPTTEEVGMAREMENLSDAKGIARAVRNYSGSEVKQGEDWIRYTFGALDDVTLTGVPEQGRIGAGAVEVTYVDRGTVGVSDGDLLIYRVTGTDMETGEPFGLQLKETIGSEGIGVLREDGVFVNFDNRSLIDKIRYDLAVTLADVITR